MRWLFDLAWVALVVFVAASSSMLPAMVIGNHGSVTPRGTSMALKLATAIVLPWLCTRGLALLARRHSPLLHFPNKNYWLTPERREATIAWLGGHSFVLGLLFVTVEAMNQWTTLQHSLPDLQLVPQPLWAMAHGAVLLGLVLWLLSLYQRFGKTP